MQFTKAFAALAILLPMAAASAIDIDATDAANKGDATWFNPGLGNCGETNGDNDLIVALSTPEYKGGSNCGKRIRVNYQGKTVDVKVVDRCVGCSQYSIDLSPAAFKKLASLDAGRIKVQWRYL